VGDPFDADSLCPHIPEGSIFVQLLGVPHPSPRKREQFYQIDLQLVKTSALAAAKALGLVTLNQMLLTLVEAVERAEDNRVYEVEDIRRH
jgi:hypothetical protein